MQERFCTKEKPIKQNNTVLYYSILFVNMRLSAIIPARFLTITFHLLLLIVILQSREEYVKAGLPLYHSDEEFKQRDMLFAGGIIAGITLTCFELLSFFTGVSMFASFTSLISILCHSAGTVTLGHLVLDTLDAQYYWPIFSFCSVIPTLIEFGVVVSVICLQQGV